MGKLILIIMYIIGLVMYIIGLVGFIPPLVAGLEVAVKNYKEKNYTEALVQTLLLLCMFLVYIIAVATWKVIL